MRKRLLTLSGCLAIFLQISLLAIAAAGPSALASIGPGARGEPSLWGPAPDAPAAASDSMKSGPAWAPPEKLIWPITTVDSPGTVGEYTSLALDAAKIPHISYYAATSGDLKYASLGGSGNCGGGTWQCDTVDSSGDMGLYSSLALDSAGHPHISYYDASNGDLKYAHYVGSGGDCGPSNSWHCETLDSAGDVGQYTSLSLDSNGRPCISYYDATDGDLRYAHFDGSSWIIGTVDSVGDVGQYTSLALDGMDRPHISYYDATAANGDLKYAHFVGTGGNCGGTYWQCDFVETAGLAGLYTSLALAANAQPRISYFGQNSLKYAYYVGSGGNCGPGNTTWQCDTIVAIGNKGGHDSLALDGAERPRISLYQRTGKDLQYAQYVGSGGNCGPGNTTWQCEIVDSAGDVGQYTSLALDEFGRPHISYHDVSNGDLKYAFDDCIPVLGADVSGPSFVLVGQLATYTATYSPPTATLPVTITWSNSTVGPTAAYSWMSPGTYTVSATVANPCGEALGALAVTVCQPVTGAGISGPASLAPGQTGLYTATYSPPTATLPVTITWSNGTVGPTAAYSWTDPGLYTIIVTVSNPCGQVSATQPITVAYPCYPLVGAQINGPTYLSPGSTGLYTATYSPPTATLPVTITWDNGTVGPTATYSWTVPGLYAITVTVANRCSQVSATLEVLVAPSCDPVTAIEAHGPAVLFAGETGVYTATSGPPTATLPVSFAWDNGTVGPTAAYSWTVPSTYTIAVTATNPCGRVSTSLTVTVLCRPLTGAGIDGPASLYTGETGVFTASFSPPTATLPVIFTWDNGTVGPTAAYSWLSAGTQTITVTATNPCQEASATLTVAVTCSPVTGAEFTWAPLTPMVGQPVTFTGTATSFLPLSYTWDLGTVTMTGQAVVHTYGTSGPHLVRMTASNGCAEDTAAHTVVVQRPPRPIYLPMVMKNWNRCYLASGSFWEMEPNNSMGEANGPLCSGQAYDGRPDDTDDFFSFPSGAGTVTVTMGSYAPGTHGQMMLYSSTGWYTFDNDPWDGWQIITDTLVGSTFWIRIYTDPQYTTTLPYTVSATFPEP
jgi:hypothetical protein